MTLRAVCLPFEDRHMGGSYVACLPLLSTKRDSFLPVSAATHNAGPWTKRLASAGLPAFRLAPLVLPGRDGGALATFPAYAWQTLRLACFIRRHRVAVVHANEESVAAAWLPACRLGGARLVLQQHGVPYASKLARFVHRHCDHLIAVSEFIGERLAQEGRPADAIVVNPFRGETDNWHWDPAARATLKERLGLPMERPVIAFIGSLTEQKRARLLVTALQRVVSQSGHRPKLLMFGDDRAGMAAELTAMSKDPAHPVDLVLMGHRSDLRDWLRASDIFAAPAIDEGFGRALVEAMLNGTPVIAAASGGHREIVTHEQTGLLVAPDDADALSGALIRLMDDAALRENLARAAHDDAGRRFLKTDYVATLQAIYAALLT
ncbi:MAG: glycosyltransferase [Alphaproteobacteria bacterium]|nr:glycosyltransferase [Alphaproteobacteria bacterium]